MASIWIDLDNAPHVPLFIPVIAELERRGHATHLSARDYGYTRDLIARTNLTCDMIGSHSGANPVMKVAGLLKRAVALRRWAGRRNIDVAVSHGSRGLVVAAAMRRIPCVTMYDYEYVSTSIFNRLSAKVILPDLIPDSVLPSLRLRPDQVAKYPGQKEELYLGGFTPDATLLDQLEIDPRHIIVVVRPPATMAHYHNPEADRITRVFLNKIEQGSNVLGICVPRTPGQADDLEREIRTPSKFRILRKPVDGLNLIWHADVIVGGGGTMNREAAAMGVPVYSVFMGQVGAIDNTLSKRGQMSLIRDVESAARVQFAKRDRVAYEEQITKWRSQSDTLVRHVCDEIIEVIAGG